MRTNTAVAATQKMLPRLVFADDHRMIAEGIERLLESDFEFANISMTGTDLLEAVRVEQPDIVLSDINMPDFSGLDALKQLRAEHNATPFVFLTMHAEPALAAAAMRAGANGYVLKLSAADELVGALKQVLEGNTYVTPSLGARYLSSRLPDLQHLTGKQREVLRLVGRGLRSKQIADQLNLSVRTVEAHKYTMMQILDVHSTLELVRKSEELGLLF